MSDESLPAFRYHPDPVSTGAIKSDSIVCKCCGKHRKYSYTLLGAWPEYEPLCPWCIADGSAHRKWEISFVDAWTPDRTASDDRRDELAYRTPRYLSWQGEQWESHCNDYCAYLGEVGGAELKELGVEVIDQVWPAVQESFDDKADMLDSLEKGGHAIGYLFRCLHCGTYRMNWDCD